MFGPICCQNPKIASSHSSSINELQLERTDLKAQLLLSNTAEDWQLLLTCIPHCLDQAKVHNTPNGDLTTF
jgi:hypothetical protein